MATVAKSESDIVGAHQILAMHIHSSVEKLIHSETGGKGTNT